MPTRKLLFFLTMVFLWIWCQPSAAEMWIWDSVTAGGWTTTRTDGTPVDTGIARDAVDPKVAIDSQGVAYIPFTQEDANGTDRIFLSRYNETDVRIWDHDTQTWTRTMGNGDPIDTGIAFNPAQTPAIAIDSINRVYVAFSQDDGTANHIYVVRYNGLVVQIWNPAAVGGWSTDLSTGRAIDTGISQDALKPGIAVDSRDQVYVTFEQSDGANSHVYLTRYNGLEFRIWDSDTNNWITNFSNGDPIDTTTANDAFDPQVEVGASNSVYVTYRQSDGTHAHIYLTRFTAAKAIEIWTGGLLKWTSTLTAGVPVDTNTANAAGQPRLAIDATGVVYIPFVQSDGTFNRIYMSRYDGTDVTIWDADSAAWTTTYTAGDPIDNNSGNPAANPQPAIDSNDRAYVAFNQSDGTADHVYLTRYDGTDVRIWDKDTPGWTTTFANGDPIDKGTDHDALLPWLAIDTLDRLYAAFYQTDGTNTHIFVSRYDGTDVRIWDDGISDWTLAFSDGDPVDTTYPLNAINPQVSVNDSDQVFVVFQQSDGANSHIFLTGYADGSTAPSPPNPPPAGGSSCFVSTASGN